MPQSTLVPLLPQQPRQLSSASAAAASPMPRIREPLELMYPIMTQAERDAFCPSAPWWTAPVIIGGSGGSGTRGSALLMHRLGVGITCEHSILDPSVVSELQHCNHANDFDLLSGKPRRAPSLVWLVGGANTSSCAVTDAQCSSLLAQPNTSSDLINLRRAVLPQYRKNLRWGMKNPHFTYMHKWLVRVFPCMAYVHTLRGVPEMVRNADHLTNRFTEAASFGVLPQNATKERRVSATVQARLADYLLLVNSGLAWWASRCMPHQIVYLPVMKISRCISNSCSAFNAEQLARVLRLDPNETLRQVQAFAVASHNVTLRSHAEALTRPLLIKQERVELLRWPPPLSVLSGERSCKCKEPRRVLLSRGDGVPILGDPGNAGSADEVSTYLTSSR